MKKLLLGLISSIVSISAFAAPSEPKSQSTSEKKTVSSQQEKSKAESKPAPKPVTIRNTRRSVAEFVA